MEAGKKGGLLAMIVTEFKSYNSKVKWPIFIAITLFTTGQWLEIFGIWSQLPLMVHQLEERWALPALITVSVQIGQVISLLYMIVYFKYKGNSLYRIAIYIKFVVTSLATLTLSFVWNKAAYIFGKKRSVGVIAITLILSAFDGTGSLCFLPYVGENFNKEYLIPYYIGETLFALVPSVVAILQGVGEDEGCQNVTTSTLNETFVYRMSEMTTTLNETFAFNMNETSSTFNETVDDYMNETPSMIKEKFSYYMNETTLESIPLEPRFGIATYFMIMFALLCFSFSTFIFLDCFKSAKRARKTAESKGTDESRAAAKYGGSQIKGIDELATSLLNVNSAKTSDEPDSRAIKFEKVLLYTITFLLTFFFYGISAGIQSYSALPYGNGTYHLAVNLSNVFLPIAIFLSIWSYSVSIKRIVTEFGVSIFFLVYIIIAAVKSPCPPFVGTQLGSALIVISWVMSQSMFMRVRCIIATRMERFGERTLTIVGFYTILGEVVGGILIYLVVEEWGLLKEKPACYPVSCSAIN